MTRTERFWFMALVVLVAINTALDIDNRSLNQRALEQSQQNARAIQAEPLPSES